MAAILTAISAIDEHVINTYPVTTEAEIIQQLKQARIAADRWATVSIAERLSFISALQTVLLEQVDSITETVMSVTGKVKTEVLLGEIYPILELISYYKKNAVKILAPRSEITSPFSFPNTQAIIERKPYGVVAIISPWNFPLQLTLNPLITALVAGNTVIFKTSELSVPMGELILQLCEQIALPHNVVQQVTGPATAAETLLDNRPDLVFMTGGLAAGRAIMTRAAQHPIPVILELGGKDAMLVFADANLKRACQAAVYGAFSNSGQVCVSVERLYVQDSCYDAFVQALCLATQKLIVGHGKEGDLGALTSLAQFEIVETHYQDALAKGAKASGPLQLQGRYLRPVVLWDVTHDMRVMQEETFGALLPVMAFSTEQQLLKLANDSQHGLNASIWSLDIAKAERIARQLKVGNWAVNDVIKNIGHPGLPFGGVKNSGFGRYHGAEGLRQFSYTVSGLTSRSMLNDEPNWFPYSDLRYQHIRGFMDCLFGKGYLWQRIKRNWPALRMFLKYASGNMRQHWRNLFIYLGIGRDF